jgi:small subunit ribosomal protein S17
MTATKITTPNKTSVEKKTTLQTFTGVVSSTKMKDTAVVVIERYVKHKKYHKFQIKRTKLMAHDPGNTKKEGDIATIESCRPISKNKAFRII